MLKESKSSIYKIKKSFARKIIEKKLNTKNLKAAFCIGSLANTEVASNKFYQDFDIHLYFDTLKIDKKTLITVRQIFEEVSIENRDNDTAIEYMVIDKPWKMMPTKKRNIGIHGTILNSLDFDRRLNMHHILGLNMWENAEILFGELEYTKKDILISQFLSDVGGIGWLEELFYKSIPFIDQADKKSYPMVTDICYYFGLSALLHYYYVQNNTVATRSRCLEFFMNQPVSNDLKSGASFLVKKKINNQDDFLAAVNHTISLLTFVHKEINKNHDVLSTANKFKFDEHSNLISTILKRDVSINQQHFPIDRTNYDEVKKQITFHISKFPHLLPGDFTDAIYSIAKGDTNIICRCYFWPPENQRRSNAIDFPEENESSKYSFIYSWEKGIITYIQRLHEIIINEAEIRPIDTIFAKIISLISFKEYLEKILNLKYSSEEIISKYEYLYLRRGVNITNMEDQFFAHLNALYSLVNKSL
ncbi:MAG: hypothetical protein EOM88_03430 [Clostridia bacterium]|nr:hypothetical protein [Bacilli bacterium]NCB20943.1 hypothetical protein [Clostridia bacterium]